MAQQQFSFRIWAVQAPPLVLSPLAPWPLGPLAFRNPYCWDQIPLPSSQPQHPPQTPYIFSSALVAAGASWFFTRFWDRAAHSSLSPGPWLDASSGMSGLCSTFLHERPELMDKASIFHHADWWLSTRCPSVKRGKKGHWWGFSLGYPVQIRGLVQWAWCLVYQKD